MIDVMIVGARKRQESIQAHQHELFRNANMFGFFSSKMGCIGSIIVSILGTLILTLLMRGCHG